MVHSSTNSPLSASKDVLPPIQNSDQSISQRSQPGCSIRRQTIAIILCAYGLLKQFRPSEPYMFVYQNTVLNISAEVLNGDVYPYWTYSYLVALVTVWTRAALQSGKGLSYLLGLLIVMTKVGSYQTLNYISLGSQCITFVFALILPSVDWKEVVARETTNKESLPLSEDDSGTATTYKEFVARKIRNLWVDLGRSYSDVFLLKWSMWWAMTTCGDLMITNYIQTLWAHNQSEESQVYNGFVEALSPLLAVVAILLLQLLKIDWNRWGELCLTVAAVADFGLLFVLNRTSNLFVMYGCYAAFRVIYQSMITITQFNLADRLVEQSFGLLFGFNTLVALCSRR